MSSPARRTPPATISKSTYPASDKPGELRLGVTYTLWIPDGVTKLRGVIVHQHGCGSGACKGGATAAYDLHWQALAKKWDCALLGPSYHQEDKQNCRLWCDPRNGSAKTFLNALREFAEQVEACRTGASAVVSVGSFRRRLLGQPDADDVSGTHRRHLVPLGHRLRHLGARATSPNRTFRRAAYRIPMMCNPGMKEKGDKRFNGAWTGTLAMFKAYRAKGAPIGFAPDPRTAHECGDSRYLAIPFFDACLALRLPDETPGTRSSGRWTCKQAWLAELLSDKAEPAASYKGEANEAVWLPNERVAKAWMEYVKTGSVSDNTPPPTPIHVKASSKGEKGVEITWDAEADFESGLQGFVIERDGKEIAQAAGEADGTLRPAAVPADVLSRHAGKAAAGDAVP